MSDRYSSRNALQLGSIKNSHIANCWQRKVPEYQASSAVVSHHSDGSAETEICKHLESKNYSSSFPSSQVILPEGVKAKVPGSRGAQRESIETRKAVKVRQRLSILWLESNNRLLSTEVVQPQRLPVHQTQGTSSRGSQIHSPLPHGRYST